MRKWEENGYYRNRGLNEKYGFKCSNHVKKKGKKNLITVAPLLQVSTNLVFKKPSVIITRKIL